MYPRSAAPAITRPRQPEFAQHSRQPQHELPAATKPRWHPQPASVVLILSRHRAPRTPTFLYCPRPPTLLTMALRAVMLLASLYHSAHASSYSSSSSLSPSPSACDPTTYALITPSPSAPPYPVTSQGQLVTSHVPQYAVCNPDRSDCTTVYAPTTYAWCSTVVPCYPHSCTVTACSQPITFSHDASYQLTTSAGGAYYIEPVTTQYVLPYTAYAAGQYDAVVVERCVGELCDVSLEHWVEEVRLTEHVAVLPVTMHTYCAEPTTLVWEGESMVVDRPSTLTWVTGSTRTSTLFVTPPPS